MGECCVSLKREGKAWMLESEKRVPESVIELLDGQGGDELTFEMLPRNDREPGEGFTVMTEEDFRQAHADHGDIREGQFAPAVRYARLSISRLVCPCGAVLVSGCNTSRGPRPYASML
jgi:hypothetical protein